MRVSTFPLRIRAVRGLLLAAALGTSACGVHQAGIRTGVNPAERLPPVDPAVVQFFGGDDPGPQGQEIGYVISLCDADEKDLALSRLRDAAAKLGRMPSWVCASRSMNQPTLWLAEERFVVRPWPKGLRPVRAQHQLSARQQFPP